MSMYGSQVSASSHRGHYINCRVCMLDETDHVFEIPVKSFGQVLFESLVRKIQLLESDYFGLMYLDSESIPCWLDHEKPIVKQVKDYTFKFAVKFYTPDPELLEEEFTRYLFALQIKRDLVEGKLHCQEHTAVLLAAFILQAEVGNYMDDLTDLDYLTSFKLLPNQSPQIELKIMTHHQELMGQSPLEAEFNLLETVRKVEMYGVWSFPAKDHDDVSLLLSVSHAGVLVFHNNTRINIFSWAKIRKLCFKRKKFILKLHPDGTMYNKGTVEFYLNSRNWAKNFWKQCIEHHSFFRMHSSRQPMNRRNSRALFASRGSSFRYSGRTQKELVEFVRDNFVAQRPFERSTSMRTISMQNSRASTPRYGTLNSNRDMHPSSISLATSASRTLDRPRPSTLERGTARSRHAASQRASYDRKAFESDSFGVNGGSGDSSRISPGFSQMSFQTFQGRLMSTPSANDQQLGLNNNVPGHGYLDMSVSRGNTLPVRSEKIDPSQFMLPRNSFSRQNSQQPAAIAQPQGFSQQSSQQPATSPQTQSFSRQNSQLPATSPHAQSFSRQNSQPTSVHQTATYNNIPAPNSSRQNTLPMSVKMPIYNNTNSGMQVQSMSRQNSQPGSLQHPFVYSPQVQSRQDTQLVSSPSLTFSQQVQIGSPQSTQPASSSPPTYSSLVQSNGNAVRDASIVPPDSLLGYRVSCQDRVDGTTGEDLPQPPPPMSLMTGGSLSRFAQVREFPSQSLSNLRSLSTTGLVLGQTGSLSSPDSVVAKGFVTDALYYIVKELLMTERTYRKDLEVIAVWFQDAVSAVLTLPHYSTELLFQAFVPLYEFHCRLLNELELRVSSWENPTVSLERTIGDLMLQNMSVVQMYRHYLDQHDEIVSQLDLATRRLPDFKRIVDEFEMQKICYLPLNAFLLKPIQRLFHYQLTFTRILTCFEADHSDAKDCKACLTAISGVLLPYQDKLKEIANHVKLLDLQNGITGIDGLNQKRRSYIREGCLQKFSRKGLQQRMFFLVSDQQFGLFIFEVFMFSDVLMYASRAPSSTTMQFKIHGQLPVANMTVNESDPEVQGTPFSFTVTVDNRFLVLVANSQEEKDKWVEDLTMAAMQTEDKDNSKLLYPTLKSNSSTEALDALDATDRQNLSQHRGNTTMHVCWHRMTSVGVRDHYISLQNQLSGFLLRKFKNSNGWQKLWVVFANFCLYFYKSYEDEMPLASLPLLGYSVSAAPVESDEVRKECVFKLQFRNHVYFFRADSKYTFERWLEVIGSVTSTARITRTFSRLDSSSMSPSATAQPPNEF